MSVQPYDQSDGGGPWIDFKEHIYPSKRHLVLRQHHATELDDRGKPKKRFLQFHAGAITNRPAAGTGNQGLLTR